MLRFTKGFKKRTQFVQQNSQIVEISRWFVGLNDEKAKAVILMT